MEKVTKMPFGKFKGQQIHELPSSYLKYASENFNEDTQYMRQLVKLIDEEWQFRERYNCHDD